MSGHEGKVESDEKFKCSSEFFEFTNASNEGWVSGNIEQMTFFAKELNVQGLSTGLQRHIAFSDSLFISIPSAQDK